MNERIQQLAEQANMIGDWGEDITKGRYFVFDNLKSLEKFAELIVRECVRIVEEDNGIQSLPIVIKEHFGVEE